MQALAGLLLLAILGLVFRALFGKPSRLLLVGSLAGTMVFLSIAAFIWSKNAEMRKLAVPQFYSLEVEPPGLHVLRIASRPGIPGLNVRPVPKGTRRAYQSFGEETLSVSEAQIRSCGWKLRPSGPLLHLHDDRCRCSPKDYLIDTGFDERFRNGTFPAIELEYVVDDRTKPTLEAIDLQVGHPFTYGNDLAMGEGIGEIIADVLAGCAALGIVGAISQAFQLRKKNNGRGTLHSPLP